MLVIYFSPTATPENMRAIASTIAGVVPSVKLILHRYCMILDDAIEDDILEYISQYSDVCYKKKFLTPYVLISRLFADCRKQIETKHGGVSNQSGAKHIEHGILSNQSGVEHIKHGISLNQSGVEHCGVSNQSEADCNNISSQKIKSEHNRGLPQKDQTNFTPLPFFLPNTFTWIAGPCAVESRGMIQETAHFLSSLGIPFLRGGCFKARSSPYYFQGYAQTALRDLRDVADQFGMRIVTEVVSEDLVEPLSEMADVLQVGTRNAQNFQLLLKLGRQSKPVLLKRGFMNTIEEFLLAAEYLAMNGNEKIILCERGIRTFETATRNTLDISAIPIIHQETYLPIIIDPSHAAGRSDIILPLVKAGLVVEASGAIVEVHPSPKFAKSDGKQSLNFQQFEQLFYSIQNLAQRLEIHIPSIGPN